MNSTRLGTVKRKDTLEKKFSDFPVPSRNVTNQTFPGLEKFNYYRPGRVWLVTYGENRQPFFSV
jgi:hypothetical protein